MCRTITQIGVWRDAINSEMLLIHYAIHCSADLVMGHIHAGERHLCYLKNEGRLLRLNVDFGEEVGESDCQLRLNGKRRSLLVFILLAHWG